MKKRQIVIILIFVGLILLIVYKIMSGMLSGNQEKKKVANSLKYINIEKVVNDTITLSVHAYGRVTSSRNVNLTAEVQGKLEEGQLPLKAGQSFQKGAVLFRINDAEQRLSLQSRKSQFLNLMASVLPDLKLDYANNFKQWENFFIALDVEKSIPPLPKTATVNEKTFLASRNILSEYYGIKADEERLSKYNVRAPFNGSYSQVMIEVGTVVNTGTQIGKIIQHSSLEVTISVNMKEVGLINEGMKVIVSSEDGSKKWNGNIERISHNVNQNTQLVDVFIGIDPDKNSPLYEGMYVQADIVAGHAFDAVELSRKIVFDDNKVYVERDSILYITEVEVKKMNESTVVVTGLKNDDHLVSQPLIGEQNNMKVIPIIK